MAKASLAAVHSGVSASCGPRGGDVGKRERKSRVRGAGDGDNVEAFVFDDALAAFEHFGQGRAVVVVEVMDGGGGVGLAAGHSADALDDVALE